MKRIVIALGLALGAAPAAAQAPQAEPVDYADAASWLCLPGRSDVCAQPLPTVALNANGYGSIGQVAPTDDPPVDCFYVYPTVSRDPGSNSDMQAGAEEQGAAFAQFARFASVCRTFAPIYRSVTLAMIPRVLAGEDVAPSFDLAYADVQAAWRHYLDRHNQGRPFVLIGHSQGTIHLSRLLAEEIEGGPAAQRLLSAMLIGFNVEVPEGEEVGGTFRHTPLCRRPGQTGCVVTYVSFRASNPPPPVSTFGRASRPGLTVACTNPAQLAGGSAPLDSYWFAAAPPLPGAPAIDWSASGPPPVPFVRTEGLASAACVRRGPVGYLSVAVNADPEDDRTDAIPGDVYLMGRPLPDWGLHLVDVNIAMGDLLRIIEAQRDAYLRR